MFTQGTVRKSKKEKEKEAAEAKRKEEEEHAARAYAEFVDAFEGEGADRKKGASAFVKAGQEGAYAPSASARGRGGVSRAFGEQSMVRKTGRPHLPTVSTRMPSYRDLRLLPPLCRNQEASGQWTISWKRSRGKPCSGLFRTCSSWAREENKRTVMPDYLDMV